MGNYFSEESKRKYREEERMKQYERYQKAFRNYNNRLKPYGEILYLNPDIRMSYYEYEEQCRSQYELELLSEEVRYGSNYTDTEIMV